MLGVFVFTEVFSLTDRELLASLALPAELDPLALM